MARIAINGPERIGRAFFKLALTCPELEVVAVNNLGDPENLAYLMRFDSAYGRSQSGAGIGWSGEGLLYVERHLHPSCAQRFQLR